MFNWPRCWGFPCLCLHCLEKKKNKMKQIKTKQLLLKLLGKEIKITPPPHRVHFSLRFHSITFTNNLCHISHHHLIHQFCQDFYYYSSPSPLFSTTIFHAIPSTILYHHLHRDLHIHILYCPPLSSQRFTSTLSPQPPPNPLHLQFVCVCVCVCVSVCECGVCM